MTPEHINSFLESAVLTFDTMLGCKLVPREPFARSQRRSEHEISGIIGLSGKAKGTVVLCLSREAALAATGAMLGVRVTEIDGNVTDAVGELTNIIAGVAKAQMEKLALDVSLPTVIVGKQHSIEFPPEAAPVCIPYDCPWGYVALEVGLIEPVQKIPKILLEQMMTHSGG